jgi:broad specificity phosphatase PhoE
MRHARKPDILLCMFLHAETIKELDDDIICGKSDDMPLLVRGERHAQAIGELLKLINMDFNMLLVTPAIRSQRTAEIVMKAAGLSLDPIICPDLHEISQGDWEGKSRKIHGETQRAGIQATPWDFRAPGGGESLRDLAHRSQSSRQYLEASREIMGEPLRVAAFTHGLPIASQVGDLLGWEASQIAGLKVPNLTDTVLTYEVNEWHVEQIAQPATSLEAYT